MSETSLHSNDAKDEAEIPPPPKDDPETLVLRGRPAKTIRFKRGLIIAIIGVSSTALIGVTWIALKPATLRSVVTADSNQNLVAAKPPEALAGAPKTYADIPKLGPPLPGDFGEAVLAQQRGVGELPVFESSAASLDQARQQVASERDARIAEQKAARTAGLIVQTSKSTASENAAQSQPSETVTATDKPPTDSQARSASSPAADPNGQAHKRDFISAKDGSSVVNPHQLAEPASPYMLSAGSIIAASLITGLRSDLPGLVTAQVTENAYDSASGRNVLIPQGSRLIGSYDSMVAFGQKRALVVWQRIIMPDASSIQIDNAPASDAQGFAGLADAVDTHTLTILKGVILSTLLGVGGQLSLGSSESDLVRAVRESTQQNTERAGQQFVGKALDVQPTITVRPGARVRIVVHKDLLLKPWVGGN